MATALFVTEEKIKSFTGIGDNVDPSHLYPFVLQAQDFYIQQTCGTKLYNVIKDYVVDNVINGTPIPTDYKLLLDDYIAPTVVHYAYYQAIPSLNFKTTNKGILSGTSEVGNPVSLEELQYLRNTVFESAKFYNERLREYLVFHSYLYPEFMSWNAKDGMMPKRTTSYYTGLVIPSKRYGQNYDCDGYSNGQINYPLN